MKSAWVLMTGTALALCGCMGSTEIDATQLQPGAVPADTAPDETSVDPANCEETTQAAGAFRRMTQVEYVSTVRDVLGDEAAEANQFVSDGLVDGFSNNMHLPADTLISRQYLEAAEKIAARAVTRLASWMPCDPASSTEVACARTFVESVGKRLFRRPLGADETARYMALYELARGTLAEPFTGRIRVVLTALLSSPNFLYHRVRGVPVGGGLARLTDHELAARLSYFLWSAPPDDELMAAADQGALSDPATLEAQAMRLWNSPRAKTASARFHSQWLELEGLESKEKDATLFPEFTLAMRQAMRQETNAFVESVLWDGDGRLKTLLSRSSSFVNEPLATLYGVTGVTGGALVPMTLPAQERAGLLTQASFLATHAHREQTSPTRRGLFIRERLLCQPMPPPPPEVNVSAPALDPTLTTRERFEAHRSVAYCASCHKLIDDIGLGMEGYDAIGKTRALEQGKPVDASGELSGTRDVDGRFNGLVELTNRLSDSAQVQDCLSRRWFVYGLGREVQPKDACSVAKLQLDFRASDRIPDLVMKLVQSFSFRHVRAVEVEVCQ